MADLRTMAALGAYGMGVVTNAVAQNTQGVRAVLAVPSSSVRAQLEAVSDDVTIDGVKIGMLGGVETIETVRAWLEAFGSRRPPVVLDPVMISTSGTRLLDEDAVFALHKLLCSGLIDVVTPNIPELAALCEWAVPKDWEGVRELAIEFAGESGAKVYAKSGHLESSDDRTDALVSWDQAKSEARIDEFAGTLVETQNTHGTGCTLSSALATFAAQGSGWVKAARRAKSFMNGAIAHADELHVGHGHGPIDQLWNTTYDVGNE
jgi:hydroxymethylpyrimidine kinase/phosphomethylpyrimidine kinase